MWTNSGQQRNLLPFFRSAVSDSEERKEEKEQHEKRHQIYGDDKIGGKKVGKSDRYSFKLCDCGCRCSHPLHLTFQLLPPPNPLLVVLQDVLHVLLHEELEGLW